MRKKRAMSEETAKIERNVKFRAIKVWRKVGLKSEPRVVNLAEFHPFMSLGKRKQPSPEVEARCDPSELQILAKELGEGFILTYEEREGKKTTPQPKLTIKVHEEDKYEKLMVYAVVRQSMRNPLRANRLKDVVKDLGAYEAHFWASIFKEIFSRTQNRLELFRPARAFKTLYHLE
jgi:hypothetical protein